MILTDKEIRKLCNPERNTCMIKPFTENALQSESYDLSIGTDIQVMNKSVKCIELDDQNAIDEMYENKKIDKSGYILSPKEYVLVSLKEEIMLPDDITAHIRPRTRFTRLGLIVSAQHCNSTYHGKLYLGLYNATDYAIKLLSGTKIAQIVFEELKSIPSDEKQYKNKKDARYQDEDEFRGADFSDEFNQKVDKMVDYLLGGKH